MLLVLYLFQFIDLCILLGCDYCELDQRCRRVIEIVATPIITANYRAQWVLVKAINFDAATQQISILN